MVEWGKDCTTVDYTRLTLREMQLRRAGLVAWRAASYFPGETSTVIVEGQLTAGTGRDYRYGG
jgi:hypothetical protein